MLPTTYSHALIPRRVCHVQHSHTHCLRNCILTLLERMRRCHQLWNTVVKVVAPYLTSLRLHSSYCHQLMRAWIRTNKQRRQMRHRPSKYNDMTRPARVWKLIKHLELGWPNFLYLIYARTKAPIKQGRTDALISSRTLLARIWRLHELTTKVFT